MSLRRNRMDYAPLLRRALRAIRCANVRSGILPPQSRFRGNDAIVFWVPGSAVVDGDAFKAQVHHLPWNNSRPISMRRISLVPAPIS